MSTFGPLEVGELIEVQAIATGPGGTTYSTTAFVSADCNSQAACVITSNPVGASGPAGTAVNLGGSATGAFQYYSAPTPTGSWTLSQPPSTIVAGSGTRYWRICCVDDPTVCSAITVVQEDVLIELRNPWQMSSSDFTEFETLSMADINALDPNGCALDLEEVAYDAGQPDNGPGAGGQGQFRFSAGVSHYLPDDPIVFPNQPGASHLHMFFGNTEVDAFTTCGSLINTGAATVQGGAGANRTGYWIPALFDGPKGGALNPRNIILPSSILVYYKSHVPVDLLSTTKIPDCLELIGGNIDDGTGGMVHEMTMPSYLERAQWGFYNGSQLVQSQTNIPTDNPTGYQFIRAAIQFPQCIQESGGQPVLSSANHLDHQHILSSANGGGNQTALCPLSHPYRIPQVTVFADYLWPANGDTSQWRLSSDINADTASIVPTAGESLHGDIKFAWNECVQQAWYDGCFDPLIQFSGPRNCSGGQTGSNGELRNLDQIQNTATINNTLYNGPVFVADPWDI